MQPGGVPVSVGQQPDTWTSRTPVLKQPRGAYEALCRVSWVVMHSYKYSMYL